MRSPPRFPVSSIWTLFAVVALRVFAAQPGSELAAAIAQTRALLERDIVPQVPGLAIAVAVNQEIVWSQGFGHADLAAKKAVTPGTRFRIGSISKPLTAAGLALLVERGRVDLDAPVQKYVPEFPHARERITTRQLAGHLGGIRHYRESETLLNRPFASTRDGLAIFQNDPLEAAPGTKYIYSTYGWTVISAVMEAAAQEEFLAFMDAQVFRPLHMTQTRPDRAGVADPERTEFYSRNAAGRFVRAPAVDSSYKWAGGGFLSTPEDLVRFGAAHLQPGFLTKKSLELLFTAQRTADGKRTTYGVGWFVGRDAEGHDILHHGGNSIGGTSILLLHPSTRTVVAIACNLTQANFIKDPARPIAEMFAPVFAAAKRSRN